VTCGSAYPASGWPGAIGLDPDRTDAEHIIASLGDAESFLPVFERHYDRIRVYLQRRAGLEPGEELAAQTFEVAFSNRGEFDPRWASAEPWLFGIATNILRHHLRSEVRRRRAMSKIAPEQDLSFDLDLDERLAARTAGRSLARVLRVLDEGQREVLLLYALAELSYEEIAEALRIPPGTVRSRLYRARQRIREHQAAKDVIRLVDPEPADPVRSADGRA
jgi:RNA polymerase sigma-70 factor (ECF subfamily)